MLIHWTFDPILFQFGPIAVRWYGLLFVAGFLLGQGLLGRMFEKEGHAPEDAAALLMYALISAILGARLVHCLVYEPTYYLANPWAILRIWEGGLASHGGVIGVVAGLAIAARRNEPALPLLWLLDRVAVCSTFAISLIRVANFLNSEIVGVPTSGTWGVVFTSVDQVPRHPVQLYEAVCYLLIGAALWVLYRKGAGTKRGLLLGLLLVLSFSARIALEFFKTAQASYDGTLPFSAGQYLSLPFVLLGLGLVVRSLRAPNNLSNQKALS